MNKQIRSIITGTGCFVPTEKIPNSFFFDNLFYEKKDVLIGRPSKEVVEKFQEITGIRERRYVSDNLVASDIAYLAAEEAIKTSQTDRETIDYIIVTSNFGNVAFNNRRSTMVPSLAAEVKNKLRIKNPKTIPHDITFGCPGWLQGMILADALIKAKFRKKILVIGAETLSRVSDPHDRDSLIYADGAGAAIVEAVESDLEIGIISHEIRSDTEDDQVHMLKMGVSYNPNYKDDTLFLKMNGKDLYKYALNHVPGLVKECLDKTGIGLNQVTKLLIHQANAKMDDAILERICKLYGVTEIPRHIMPMTIHEFGNSSVATVPTLLDLLLKKQLPDHDEVKSGDIFLLASVGAGMNINAMVYKMP